MNCIYPLIMCLLKLSTEGLHISRASFHAGRIIAVMGKNGADYMLDHTGLAKWKDFYHIEDK